MAMLSIQNLAIQITGFSVGTNSNALKLINLHYPLFDLTFNFRKSCQKFLLINLFIFNLSLIIELFR